MGGDTGICLLLLYTIVSSVQLRTVRVVLVVVAAPSSRPAPYTAEEDKYTKSQTFLGTKESV